MKKPIVLIFALCVSAFFILSCNFFDKKTFEENNYSYLGFYSEPGEIISELSGKEGSSREHFMLGIAYKKKQIYEKAIIHFANSAFKTNRNTSLKHFPVPVLKFLDSYKSKSDYYEDALYEIADLYYYYREHAAVIKLADTVSSSKTALYLEISLLKSRSLSDQKKYDEALEVLKKLTSLFSDTKSASVVYIRTASLYEKIGDIKSALREYLKAIKSSEEGWENETAVKRISSVLSKEKIELNADDYFLIAKGFYIAKNYTEGIDFARKSYESGLTTVEFYKLLIKLAARSGDERLSDRILSGLKDKEKHFQIMKAFADELFSMKKHIQALKIYDDIASSGIEPYARESLKKASAFSAERKAAGHENMLTRFITKYPTEQESSYFYWILGRNNLKANNNDSAVKYFEDALKNIPEGNYSDRHRFWLQKIYQERNNKPLADKYLKELLAFNPDSSFAWILIRKTLPQFKLEKLKSDFDKAVSSGNLTDILSANLLLYAKEMNAENKNSRIKRINHPQIAKYNDFSNSLISLDLDSKYSKNLKKLERYFVIGYEDAISREVKLLPDEESAIRDKYKTLLYYSSKYGQFYYGVLYGIELLKLNGIKENISLLFDEANKVLYPQSHNKCASEYSARFNVSTLMVYSLIRAESLFNHDAVSPVGAVGLMQLMPDTARGVARDLSLKRYDLKDPCTSMLFGAKYIAWLDKYYKGVYAYMVGAYNAGPGNVNKWKDRPELSDMDYFSEFIPFIETRYYIVRTDKFLTQYKILYPSSK